MEIILTYEGRVPGQKRTAGNNDAIWAMRKAFHGQLVKLWGKEPFDVLKEWEDTSFAAGAPRFVQEARGAKFVPLYSRDVGVGVRLEITLLGGMPAEKRVIKSGDLDNRFKRVIDALRVPKGDELDGHVTRGERWHCLIDDDDAVTEVRAEVGTYLASDDPAVAFVIVRVRPTAQHVTLENLAMVV